jgi:hypothetical protein
VWEENRGFSSFLAVPLFLEPPETEESVTDSNRTGRVLDPVTKSERMARFWCNPAV